MCFYIQRQKPVRPQSFNIPVLYISVLCLSYWSEKMPDQHFSIFAFKTQVSKSQNSGLTTVKSLGAQAFHLKSPGFASASQHGRRPILCFYPGGPLVNSFCHVWYKSYTYTVLPVGIILFKKFNINHETLFHYT